MSKNLICSESELNDIYQKILSSKIQINVYNNTNSTLF